MQSKALEQIESLILHPEVRGLVGPPETLTVCETKICDLPDPITQQKKEFPILDLNGSSKRQNYVCKSNNV